jgi:hypothetical protein
MRSVLTLLLPPCRVSLTSCCATFWARPDLTSSAVLWGDIETWATRKQLSLAEWLAARRAGMRRLRLDFTSLPGDPASAVLRSLAGSPGLAELTLLSVRDAVEATWAPLAHLPALSRLEVRHSCLLAVPEGLAPRLLALGLSGNKRLGEGGASAFTALEGLSALTRLDLSNCSLRGLPPQLSALSALADLRVSGNPGLGDGDGAAFAPLRHRASLTRLECWASDLKRVPWQLSALTGLVELSLAGSKLGGREGDGAFLPLSELLALTRLDLSHCGLARLPPQLAPLGALAELDVSFNEAFREGGPDVFEPLGDLVGLRRLALRMCSLQRLPRQLGNLKALAELDASFNWALGKEGAGATGDSAFAALEGLSALTRLDLSSCTVASLPRQLSHLAALATTVG